MYEAPRLNRRTFSIGSAAAAVLALAPVTAQEATPVGGDGPPPLPPLPDGAIVVAEGLFNPRYIAIDDDGTLFVTEQGVGGDEVIPTPFTGTGEVEGTPEGGAQASPVSDEQAPPPSTRGYTGQVTQIDTDGTATVLIDGLLSYSDGVGPHGIALVDGALYYAIGGMGVGFGLDPLPEENTLNLLDIETGTSELVTELSSFEEDDNPDGSDVNPNLYAIAARSDGMIAVVDAGGNAIYTVDPDSGEAELLAVVPNLSELTGTEPPAGGEPRQAVPTSIYYDVDDVLHIALLSEGWPPDGPSILTYDEDIEEFATETTGRAMVTGIALGPDGFTYHTQLLDVFGDGPPIGSVHRVLDDGATEPVIEGLVMPHGIAINDAGDIFVTTNALMSAPGMPAGQLLRFDGLASS